MNNQFVRLQLGLKKLDTVNLTEKIFYVKSWEKSMYNWKRNLKNAEWVKP